MRHDRAVFDTNVLISALLFTTSRPARALELAITGGQLVGTSATLRELVATFLSPKFDGYVSRQHRDALLLRLSPLIEIVQVAEAVEASRDPNDDKFLEAAVNGKAGVIVSGDRDLLELHPFRGIAILSPTVYLAGNH